MSLNSNLFDSEENNNKLYLDNLFVEWSKWVVERRFLEENPVSYCNCQMEGAENHDLEVLLESTCKRFSGDIKRLILVVWYEWEQTFRDARNAYVVKEPFRIHSFKYLSEKCRWQRAVMNRVVTINRRESLTKWEDSARLKEGQQRCDRVGRWHQKAGQKGVILKTGIFQI